MSPPKQELSENNKNIENVESSENNENIENTKENENWFSEYGNETTIKQSIIPFVFVIKWSHHFCQQQRNKYDPNWVFNWNYLIISSFLDLIGISIIIFYFFYDKYELFQKYKIKYHVPSN